MNERIVILIPASLEDEQSQYWKNFVWHVRNAFEKEKVVARLVIGVSEERT